MYRAASTTTLPAGTLPARALPAHCNVGLAYERMARPHNWVDPYRMDFLNNGLILRRISDERSAFSVLELDHAISWS